MPSNIELKMRVPGIEPVRELLATITGKSTPDFVMKQEDVFFNATHGRLKLRIENHQASGSLIQYERADQEGAKLCDYVKVDVPDAAGLKEALTRAYGVLGRVAKNREVWMVDQTRVHLDVLDGLGSFVEFEVLMQPSQSIAEGETIANELLTKLKLEKAERISGAYMDLILGKENLH